MKTLVLAALLSAAPAALAQDAAIGQGTRVKVRTATIKAVVGSVASSTADSVSIRDDRGGAISVARKDITQLYVSSGRTAGEGAKKGALWGAGVGVLGGAAMLTDPCASAPDKPRCDAAHKNDNRAALGVSMFAAMTIGGAIAGAVVKAEEWQELNAQSRFSVRPKGLGFVATFSFR